LEVVNRIIIAVVFSCGLAFSLLSPASGEEFAYDVVIRGGRIVDGSGNPWFHADVAVKGDRIVAVARDLSGKAGREIDAKRLIVAPGLIDMHSHSDFLLLEDGDAQSKIRQGVTTEVLGEGPSAGPYLGKLSPRSVLIDDKPMPITTLGEYFAVIDKAGISTNVASYVGLDNVWQCVMGTSHEHPSAEQIGEMKKLVEGAMRDGAFGLSSQVMMPPVRWQRPMSSRILLRLRRSMAVFIRHIFGTKVSVSSTALRKQSPSASGRSCRWM